MKIFSRRSIFRRPCAETGAGQHLPAAGLLPLLCAVLLLQQCSKPFAPFLLVSRRHSCTIVIASGGSAPAGHEAELPGEAALAAAELRLYLTRLLSLSDNAIAISHDDQAHTGSIILLGRPGVNSRYARAARRLRRKWSAKESSGWPSVRFDAWNEEGSNFLAITTPGDEGLLRAVHTYLDALGVRFPEPGRSGERVPRLEEVRVLQSAAVVDTGIPLCGFLPGCSRQGSARPDSSWLLWWARQGITHVPLHWARDPRSLQSLGLQGVAGSEPGVAEIWRPGFCVSDEATLRQLVRALFTGQPQAGLYLLDAAAASPGCTCARCQALGGEQERWLHLVRDVGREMAAMKQRGELHKGAKLLAVNAPLIPAHYVPEGWPGEEILLGARMPLRCYNHTITDPRCAEVNAEAIAALQKWRAAHNFARLAVVEGWYDADLAGLPLVLDRVITADLSFYRRLGLSALFCEAPALSSPGVQRYQNYLFGQTLRHDSIDADSLRRSYAAFAFPGINTIALEYLEMLDEAFANVQAWRRELPERIRALEQQGFAGELLPLARFRSHFRLYPLYSDLDEGVAWERTFQLIHDARHVMDEMLDEELPDPTLERLLELERQLRFAELTVTFYDNMIRSLTLGEDEPAMQEEAAIRLRQVVKKMEDFRMPEGVCGPGTALEYSGLEQSARTLLVRLQKRFGVPYERVYEE